MTVNTSPKTAINPAMKKLLWFLFFLGFVFIPSWLVCLVLYVVLKVQANQKTN